MHRPAPPRHEGRHHGRAGAAPIERPGRQRCVAQWRSRVDVPEEVTAVRAAPTRPSRAAPRCERRDHARPSTSSQRSRASISMSCTPRRSTRTGRSSSPSNSSTPPVDKAHAKAKDDVGEEGKKSADSDLGSQGRSRRRGRSRSCSRRAAGRRPAAIRQQRDRLIARVNRRLAPEDIRYEKEGDDRLRSLQLMEVAYSGAYQHVADRSRSASARTPSRRRPPARRRPDLRRHRLHRLRLRRRHRRPPIHRRPHRLQPRRRRRPRRGRSLGSTRCASSSGCCARPRRTRRRRTAGRSRALATTPCCCSRTGRIERSAIERAAWERFWDRIRSWGKAADDRTLAWEEARTAQLGADLQRRPGIHGRDRRQERGRKPR